MIKLTDKDGTKADIFLRGALSHIKSNKALKDMLDKSVSIEGLRKMHPSWPDELLKKMVKKYSEMTYREIMRDFGIVNKAVVRERGTINWREEDHPRAPEGTTTGGQFVEKAESAARKAAGLEE